MDIEGWKTEANSYFLLLFSSGGFSWVFITKTALRIEELLQTQWKLQEYKMAESTPKLTRGNKNWPRKINWINCKFKNKLIVLKEQRKCKKGQASVEEEKTEDELQCNRMEIK